MTRVPTDQEKSALLGLLSNASGYKNAMSPAQSKDIGAIDSPKRAWTLFIVLYPVVEIMVSIAVH